MHTFPVRISRRLREPVLVKTQSELIGALRLLLDSCGFTLEGGFVNFPLWWEGMEGLGWLTVVEERWRVREEVLFRGESELKFEPESFF